MVIFLSKQINCSANVKLPNKKDFSNPAAWENITAECFGGNHMIEALQNILQKYKGTPTADMFKHRLMVIYQGLSDEEMLQVNY
jgi:hypothetical protein